jgi:hypothetical protein
MHSPGHLKPMHESSPVMLDICQVRRLAPSVFTSTPLDGTNVASCRFGPTHEVASERPDASRGSDERAVAGIKTNDGHFQVARKRPPDFAT